MPQRGPDALTDKQEAFCLAFLSNGRDKTKAFITAGYSTQGRDKQYISSKACHLFDLPRVRMRIEELTRAALDVAAREAKDQGSQVVVDEARTLLEAARVAFVDPMDFHDPETGEPLPLQKIPRDARAAIAGIKYETVVVNGVSKTCIKEYKTWAKPQTLELLMRHLGMFERDNMQRGAGSPFQNLPKPVVDMILARLESLRDRYQPRLVGSTAAGSTVTGTQ